MTSISSQFALADIADVEIAGLPVEREAPRVPQAVARDLPIRAGPIDVDSQHLAESALQILRVILRIAARAAVAHPHVEASVGAERELPAVVVGVGLFDAKQLSPPKWRLPCASPILDHACVPAHVGVVDVEEAVRGEVRVERDGEEPLLATRLDESPDVEERLRKDVSVLDDANPPGLLHDVDPAGLAPGGSRLDGGDEPGRDPDELQVERPGGRRYRL